MAAVRWARGLDHERVWAIENCRHVSRRLEQALLAAGERVIRVAPKMMGASRRSERERGKSDQIDALAVARAAVKDGVEQFPAAYLDEPAMEIRLLLDHREDLVAERTRTVVEGRGLPEENTASESRSGRGQPRAPHHRDHPRATRPGDQGVPRSQRSRRQATKGALRSLKRHLARRFYRLLAQPPADQPHATNDKPITEPDPAAIPERLRPERAIEQITTAPSPMVCIS